MKKIGLLALALLCLAGCSAAAPVEDPETPPSAYIADQVLEVRLAGNPTTGYEWSWSLEGNNILQEQSYEYIPEDTSGLRDGAGGLCLFRFEPMAAGEAVLHFAYARPWENEAPADSYTVQVAVTETDGQYVINLA